MRTHLKMMVCAALLLPAICQAQMPHDAIYMNKNAVCVASLYGHSTWSQYWENSFKRENLNIGTHTTQSVMVMPAIGISKRVNVILSLPYVWTSTSAGNLLGQRGIQDISAWLKVNAFQRGGFSVHAIVGGSLPMGDYVPDFQPMSIGMQCRTLTGRLLLNYKHPATGLYVTTHGSYGWRSNIRVDRDAYLADDRMYNVDQVSVPNTYDAALRVGVLRRQWQAEAFTERTACLSGDYIRRNDMPFPTNNAKATIVGVYARVQPRNIGVNARVGQVIDGVNTGQSTSYTVGLLYLFNWKKP